MVDVTDNFNRADGALGSNWATIMSAPLVISGNAAIRSGSFVVCACHWSADTFQNDQYSEIVVATTNVDYIGSILRSSTTANGNYYYCLCHNSDGRIYIGKAVNAVSGGTGHSDLAVSGGGATFLQNDVLRFEVVGNRLALKKNSVELFATTDSTFTSGRPGLITYQDASQNGKADSFLAGPLTAVATSTMSQGLVIA